MTRRIWWWSCAWVVFKNFRTMAPKLALYIKSITLLQHSAACSFHQQPLWFVSAPQQPECFLKEHFRLYIKTCVFVSTCINAMMKSCQYKQGSESSWWRTWVDMVELSRHWQQCCKLTMINLWRRSIPPSFLTWCVKHYKADMVRYLILIYLEMQRHARKWWSRSFRVALMTFLTFLIQSVKPTHSRCFAVLVCFDWLLLNDWTLLVMLMRKIS